MSNNSRANPNSVCVVVTTYNHAGFLRRAVESILEQTVPANEIIVIDDGSTDFPGDTIADYCMVRLIRQENQGLSQARNRGVSECKSRYIIFLDADDRLLNTAIQTGLACASEYPDAACVYGGHLRILSSGPSVQSYRAMGVDPLSDLLAGNVIGMHGTVLFRKEAITEVGGYDPALRMCEDYDIFLRIAQSGAHIRSHANVVAEYYIHESNMSNRYAKMLGSALSVHRRYRPAESDAVRWSAWESGRRAWIGYYLSQALHSKRPTEFASTLIVAIRSEPARTAKYAAEFFSKTVFLLPPKARRSPPRRSKRRIDFGAFCKPWPISLDFGWDRGTPVDRYYIGEFLAANKLDIKGVVLEVGDSQYSTRYGGQNISKQEILHVDSANASATIVGDISANDVLPKCAFDCIVLTQTLQFVFCFENALKNIYEALRPGGVLLLTVPGISQIDRGEWGHQWYWSFTSPSITTLLTRVFGYGNVCVSQFGNVYAAIAMLEGLAIEDTQSELLAINDAAYPVIVTARAEKRT
ncbi:glycosyltransferase [Alsobacter sp. SYSU BS001988]